MNVQVKLIFIFITFFISSLLFPIKLDPSTYNKTKVTAHAYSYNDSSYYVTKIYYKNEIGKVTPIQKAYGNDGFINGLEEVLSFSRRHRYRVVINASVFDQETGEPYGIQMKDGKVQKKHSELKEGWLLGSDRTGILYTFKQQDAAKVIKNKQIKNT
jgi:exopolysaccharide biosynthesis protein